MTRFSKVGRLAGILALTAAFTLGACSSTDTATDDTSAAVSSSASGPWTFTDDTGKTVELDAQPTNIAAFADYAAGLLSYGVTPTAIFGRMDVATDERFSEYDISNTAIVGNSYGEIDLEALAASDPDIIVTGIYPTDREGTLDLEGPLYAFADREQQDQLEKIAPIVAIEIGGSGADVTQSFNKLASALGASEDRIDEARTEYDAAVAALTETAGSSDLEVTQMYADASGIYLVKPADEPETAHYTELGVTYTNLNPDGDYYWDIYTWENAADMMTGDVLLLSEEGMQADELAEQATFADHPALKAGQTHEWGVAAFDYHSQAEQMTRLTDILKESKKVTS